MNRKRAAFMPKHGRFAGGRAVVCAAALLALSSCVSLGEDPPPSLFTLTPETIAPAGHQAQGTVDQAIAVFEPQAPRRLDVVRVPVQVNPSTIAYLQDAVWVEKPARLFSRLLAETIRTRQTRLVIDGADIRHSATTKLSGQLVEMGYDSATRSVVVRYDAVLEQPGGTILSRRFEASVQGIPAEAGAVGPALNEAANKVAAEVAEWVG